MFTFRKRAAIAVSALVLSAGAAGGVVAATQSSDEAALQPSRPAADKSIEMKVSDLLSQMTLKEKLMQVELFSDGQVTSDDGTGRVVSAAGKTAAKDGLGSVFSLTDPKLINQLQHIAVEESRLHIPILFAFDTIHGYRTIFPIPLGAASSFDPSVVSDDHRIGARESAAVGLKQIYSPMVDVSHEARWGRISEGNGEDPYLGSVMAAARVKAAQGSDYSAPDKVVTSVKHYAAYGQPEGGRDYNTTDMSEQRLRNMYLPPFKAAIDAGADTAMCSFNAINGVPGCANPYTETDILKKEWHFDGFIESDYTAIAELRACPSVPQDGFPCGHGVAADAPDAAALAFNAGTDSEMVSTFMRDHGEQLVSSGKLPMNRLDDAVRRILRIKFRAGLFDHPYVDPAQADAAQLKPDAIQAARDAGGKSMVLLKNDGGTMPLDKAADTAVIGPLANSKHDMLGPWWGRGDDNDAVTVLDGITTASTGTTTFAQGCTLGHKEPPDNDDSQECADTSGFADAVAKANAADQVVLAVGESREMSGEAAARSEIDLPGQQEELVRQIVATGKPVAVVLFNGRPLTLGSVATDAKAILEAWYPGVQAGNSVADVVFGKVNPGGKLPVSFPRRVGQVPIYYNHEPTGRPCDVNSKWDSRYRDIKSCDPEFVFGYGLSYTTFDVSGPQLSATSVKKNGSLTATVHVENTGDKAGDEVVQLYISDPVASISQPVRRLRGFERVTLAGHASTDVTFTLDKSDFGFYDNRGKFVVEPGRIDVYTGDSSKADKKQSFTVTG